MANNASDVLIETLIDWGVDTIFGLPGDGINGLMESLTSVAQASPQWPWRRWTRRCGI